MARLTTLLLLLFLALVLCYSLQVDSRPLPAVSDAISSKTQHGGVEAEQAGVTEDSCEGAAEEECLMRRTLAAHLDYIYTQKHKP